MLARWLGLWFAVCVAQGIACASEPSSWPRPSQAAYTAKVTRVFDGDTVTLSRDQAPRIKARIIGIDAPELCQTLGRESGQFLKDTILNATVGVQPFGRDKYGRELVVLWHQNQDVGAQRVELGLAWAYVWKGQPSVYIALEQKARQANRGVFKAEAPEHPRAFRKRHGPCFR